MAEAWGEKISDQTIGKALKKMGFTIKKITGIEKELKKEGSFAKKSAHMTE